MRINLNNLRIRKDWKNFFATDNTLENYKRKESKINLHRNENVALPYNQRQVVSLPRLELETGPGKYYKAPRSPIDSH